MRMFANAVMFNPLPTRERSFGRTLRLRRNGGEVVRDDDVGSDSDREEGSETSSSEGEGGEGIIADAREMFEDTMEKVREWRRVEGERMERKDSAGDGGGLRGSSVDVPESEAGEGEGERRKRRRGGE